MVDLVHLPNERSVMQVGLYSSSQQEVQNLIDRVTKYNQRKATNVVLDLEWHEKGDAQSEVPHCKIRLTFPSPEVQENFWLE